MKQNLEHEKNNSRVATSSVPCSMFRARCKGFTLVEMLVAVGIFAVIATVLLARNSRFQSETILTNTAYEVALSIREAQVFGLSVVGATNPSGGFGGAYGISIGTGGNNLTSTSYLFCVDNNPANFLCNAFSDEVIKRIDIRNGIYVKSVCGYSAGSSTCSPATNNTDIFFKRPDPDARIVKDKGGAALDAVEITLSSGDDSKQKIIKVTNTGQITVL